jgi:hypothetical protein
MSSELDD